MQSSSKALARLTLTPRCVCEWALPLKHGRQVQALHPERETGMPALHMQILTRSCCWARRTSRTDGVLIASINNMLSA